MLPAKYIALLFFVFVVMAIFGAILSGAAITGEEGYLIGEGDTDPLNKILFWQTISSEEGWGFFEVVGGVLGFFQGLFDLITWNFSYLDGDMEIFKVVVLYPLSALVVYGLIMTLVGIFQKSI